MQGFYEIVIGPLEMWPIVRSTDSWSKNNMGVSKNRGTPKSSILIGFSIINHPFSGTPIFGNTHIEQGMVLCYGSFLRDDSLLRESWPNGW